MISEQDLNEAIAECQGVRNPDAHTARTLAACYVILDHMKDKQAEKQSATRIQPQMSYDSRSEFMDIIKDRPYEEFMPVIDELLETLKVLNPRLYAATLRKLS